jgi:hypothetical protein
MTSKRAVGLVLLLLASVFMIWLGFPLSRAKPLGNLDFRALYFSSECLVHGCAPYSPEQMRAYYLAHGGIRPGDPDWLTYVTVVFLNLPTIFFVTVPFTLFSYASAQLLWTSLITFALLGAVFLMWSARQQKAPLVASCLLALLVGNSQVTLGGGNAAGLTVSLCTIASWLFIEGRFAWLGVLCMAASLAMKPHDSGLVWLYFLLARGLFRRQAWIVFCMNAALCVAAVAWVAHIDPHWLDELRSNIQLYSSHGGANDPGILGDPTSPFRKGASAVYPGMVCNLQSVVAVFRDDPRFYNPFTYLFLAPFLAVWAMVTLRSTFSKEMAYLGLAAIVPFTLLITYHRTTDAKLLLLTVPACAMLWARGGVAGKLALVLTGLGILVAGDISLIVLGILVGQPDWVHAGWLQKIPMILKYRPIPVILVGTGIFYLWAYWKRAREDASGSQLPVIASAEG